MAIISFWSNGKEETAKTLSISAIATYMAIERNFKILVLSTNYNDSTLENCYWEQQVSDVRRHIVGLGTGIEELAKAIVSHKSSPEIVTNYTKTVFKNRLEVLPSIKTSNYQEYDSLRSVYPEILRTADQYYDLIFVDLNKGIDNVNVREVLEMSELVVVNLTQRLSIINDYIDLKMSDPLFRRGNIMTLIGRYDKFSKYNSKNIARYLKEKNVCTVPYSTLFFEAANEGKVADFFLRFRNVDENDRNATFINEVRRATENIIYCLQEEQMKR
ncbi:MAG: hypothetical protein IKP28_00275 [Clostridia bacterium]|nr:hypothetical protein [Clostridia bacterium]